MKIKPCENCGYHFYQKSDICPRCKTPVKKTTGLLFSISGLLIVSVVLVFVIQFPKSDSAEILPPPKPIPTPAVENVKAQHPLKIPEKNLSKVYVNGKTVNLREHPTVKSPTIKKLKKGQLLTQVEHVGEWVQVLMDDKEGTRGWVHASLVEKFIHDQPSKKTTTPHQAFRVFRKYFKQFNAEIKTLKGTTFFENVEYLDHGVIQITATSIFLSAPEPYKQQYVRMMSQKWSSLRKTGLPTAVNIVDNRGFLRMANNKAIIP